MAIEEWVAGSALPSYTSSFGSEINSIVSGNAILSSVIVDNSLSPGDAFGQISLNIGSITSGAGVPTIDIYLYPLNADNSTYGDGRFGSSAAGPPLSGYFFGRIYLIPSVTQAQEGSMIWPMPISFTKMKLVMYNNSGATLNASGNTIYMRTLNRQVV